MSSRSLSSTHRGDAFKDVEIMKKVGVLEEQRVNRMSAKVHYASTKCQYGLE